MKSRIYARKKSTKEQTPDFSTAPAQPMFQSRSFVVQPKQTEQSQPPDLKTAMRRAARYGHSLGRMQPKGSTAATTEEPKTGTRQPTQSNQANAPQVLQAKPNEGALGVIQRTVDEKKLLVGNRVVLEDDKEGTIEKVEGMRYRVGGKWVTITQIKKILGPPIPEKKGLRQAFPPKGGGQGQRPLESSSEDQNRVGERTKQKEEGSIGRAAINWQVLKRGKETSENLAKESKSGPSKETERREEGERPQEEGMEKGSDKEKGSKGIGEKLGGLSEGEGRSYEEARKMIEGRDVKELTNLSLLGGGMNKKAYKVEGTRWVVLVTKIGREGKERVIRSEVEKLDDMGKQGVPVPSTGDWAVKEKVFKVKEGGEDGLAFLEEAVTGTEMEKADPMKFPNQVSKLMEEHKYEPSRRIETLERSIAELRNVAEYLSEHEIPDFQLMFSIEKGYPVVIDPGDPVTSQQGMKEKDKSKVEKLITMFEGDIDSIKRKEKTNKGKSSVSKV